MKIATDIKTEDWGKIIRTLVKEGWKIRSKYRGIDAGIDNDFLILSKKTEQITFGWTNYFEGEIKCSDQLFDYLTRKFGVQFVYGDPNALAPSFFENEKSGNIGNRLKNLFRRK